LTTKEILSNKDTLFKESEKTRTQLKTELVKQEKALKKANDTIENLRAINDAHDDQNSLIKTLEGEIKKVKADVDTTSRADTRMAHQISMAAMKLEREKLLNEREVQKKQNQDDRVKLEYGNHHLLE
jgi:hypothetical protein